MVVAVVKRNTTRRNALRRAVASTRAACWLCGGVIDYAAPFRLEDGALNPDAFTIDHVVPLARGGSDTIDNVRAAHRACNRAKSDKAVTPVLRRAAGLLRPGG